MNGNGQVIVAGLFLVTSIAVAMFAVRMFEVPTYEPEAKPIELLQFEGGEAIFSPAPIELLEVNANAAPFNLAPIELLLQQTESTEQGLTPEQLYHGISAQALAQAKAVSEAKAFTHPGTCSGRY